MFSVEKTVTMDSFKADVVIHGVFVNVGGTGVLVVGDPGIGKSECALELVARGHRLIADDVVEIVFVDGQSRVAARADLIEHFRQRR